MSPTFTASEVTKGSLGNLCKCALQPRAICFGSTGRWEKRQTRKEAFKYWIHSSVYAVRPSDCFPLDTAKLSLFTVQPIKNEQLSKNDLQDTVLSVGRGRQDKDHMYSV